MVDRERELRVGRRHDLVAVRSGLGDPMWVGHDKAGPLVLLVDFRLALELPLPG